MYHLKEFDIDSALIEGEAVSGNWPEHPPFHPGKKGFLSFDLRQQCPLRARERFASGGGEIDVQRTIKPLKFLGLHLPFLDYRQ